MKNKLLVINLIDSISNVELDHLMKYGFAYVKLPDNCQKDFKRLTEKTLDFFRQDESKKNIYPVNDRFEGFTNHKYDLPPQSAQNLIFSLNNPLGPFIEEESLLSRISTILQKRIGFSLIEKILERAGLQEIISEVVTDSYSAYTLVYYPEPKGLDNQYNLGLKGHKDWDLITVLLIDSPGLEVLIEGVWQSVLPKPGYVVVNLSNALEIITGKRCNAVLHRVRVPNKERLSIGLFIGPNKNNPLKDYTTGVIKYASYTEYQSQQTKIEKNSTHVLQHLLECARGAMDEASMLGSLFPVGASILAGDGKIYTGYNVHKTDKALPQCAENAAIDNMTMHGSERIAQMVVVSKAEKLILPCISCQRKIHQFILPDAVIYIFNSENISYPFFANELLISTSESTEVTS